jgi:hypothetical protein
VVSIDGSRSTPSQVFVRSQSRIGWKPFSAATAAKHSTMRSFDGLISYTSSAQHAMIVRSWSLTPSPSMSMAPRKRSNRMRPVHRGSERRIVSIVRRVARGFLPGPMPSESSTSSSGPSSTRTPAISSMVVGLRVEGVGFMAVVPG